MTLKQAQDSEAWSQMWVSAPLAAAISLEFHTPAPGSPNGAVGAALAKLTIDWPRIMSNPKVTAIFLKIRLNWTNRLQKSHHPVVAGSQQSVTQWDCLRRTSTSISLGQSVMSFILRMPVTTQITHRPMTFVLSWPQAFVRRCEVRSVIWCDVCIVIYTVYIYI